jgi:hypothetical protein
MGDTQQLLTEYADTGSESAFRELVGQYIDLVYSTARRLVGGDVHLAQDVAQRFFCICRETPANFPGNPCSAVGCTGIPASWRAKPCAPNGAARRAKCAV